MVCEGKVIDKGRIGQIERQLIDKDFLSQKFEGKHERDAKIIP